MNGALQIKILKRIDLGENGCWIYSRGKTTAGYGVLYHEEKQQLAHRLSYEAFIGPIPEGMNICHRCDNPPCVNYNHLFAGTQKQNLKDMKEKGRNFFSKRNHCPKGHIFDGENTIIYRGYRICKTCKYESNRQYHKRRKSNESNNHTAK